MRTTGTGIETTPNAGVASHRLESLNGVLAELQDYVRKLKSHELYCDTARRFHEQERTRSTVVLTVWEIAGPSAVLNYRKLCAALKDSPIPVSWYRFPAAPAHKPLEENIGNVHVTTVDSDFPLPGGSSALGVAAMEIIKARFKTGWPDIIMSDHFFSGLGVQDEALDATLNNCFHFVEPGGLLVTVEGTEPRLSKFMEENGGTRRSAGADDVWIWYNEPNIYEGHRGSIADRKKIFDKQTCEDAIVRTIDRLNLDEGSRVLDVGTGDGRFSKHIYAGCQRKRWIYGGLEMSPNSNMRPLCNELPVETIADANFFGTEWSDKDKAGSGPISADGAALQPDEAGRENSTPSARTEYSAIFLFFVLHAFKFWQFFIFRAYELLKPGGYLVLGFRDDNFCYWLHGVFDDSTKSPVKNSVQGYWDKRSKLGVRNSDQMYNVISPVESIRFAEKLGFKVAEMARVSNVREYEVLRQHFCPDDQGPAYWNIARVGVTRKDDRDLRECFQPESVGDTLSETMVVFILKKS